MPRYDVFLEGRTENSTCYFGVAVMADDQKEAEFLGHSPGTPERGGSAGASRSKNAL